MIAPVPFFEDRGTPVRIYEISTSLQALGIQVTVFCYHLGRDVDNTRIARIPNFFWYRRTSAGPSYHEIYLDSVLGLRTLFSCLTSKFDIIHACLHEGAAIGLMVRSLKRIPVVFDAHGSLTDEMLAHKFIKKNGFSYGVWLWLERALDQEVDAILTSSPVNAQNMVKKFGVNKEKVFLVEDGVDTTVFRPGYDVSKLREELGIPAGRKIVVYLGILDQYQGTDCLVRAIPHVVDEVKNAHFLIMGFPNVKKYVELAKKLKVFDNVTFTGKVDHSKAHYYLALGTMAIAPKLSLESEGNAKVYHFMASGLPTVAFDHPVNRYIMGELGIYARMGDHLSLADCIKKVLVDDRLANELGMKVHKKAVAEYSWTKAAVKIIRIYEQLMNTDLCLRR